MSATPTNEVPVSAPATPSTTALSVSTPAWTAGIYGQLDAARPVAELLAKSELVPKGFQGKPMDILIAGAMGARLGLDLFSSLSGIAVVNGRATLWGDALLAVCQQHPAWEDYQQEITGEGDAQQAVVTVKRKGRSPHTETFSVADAKRAGLWGKQGPWSQHPSRMMALRARAFALRTVFADALAGFHSREEMEDTQEAEVLSVRSEPVPARTAQQFEQPATKPVPVTPTTPAAPHPSIAAARELYRALEKKEKGLGKRIVDRLCKLAGGATPQAVPEAHLEQFGKDVASLAKDLDAAEATLAEWEREAAAPPSDAQEGAPK